MAVDEVAASATAAYWLDQTTAAASEVTDQAVAGAAAAWAGFTGWYSLTEISERARESAEVSGYAQQLLAGVMSEYVGQVVALLRNSGRITVPTVGQPEIRNGVNPVRVHARTAEAYRRTYAVTEDELAAAAAAVERERELIETDLLLASRQAETDTMVALEVEHYRRVLRPELSKSGSCGLCIRAAERVYTVGDLMPIHPPTCKCRALPIENGVDPAYVLNEEDLKAVQSVGSNRTDLSRVRLQVSEHGEHGPTLTVRGQKFTGRRDLGGPPPVEVARRQLEVLEPVLASLERRAAAGENVAGPLEYQRRLVAKLRATADA